jgi:uncharacterized membrane protein YfcA
MVSFGAGAVLVAGGVVAGVLGTAGGITSLVSYPALLLVGLSPFAANVANLVGLIACWPASAVVSGRELSGQSRWLRRGVPVAAAGGAVGTVLLLTTSSAVFTDVVPVLVALGSVALLVQPWLTARVGRDARDRWARVLVVVFGLSVYGGYFGAGSGVMLLVAALVMVNPNLPVANAVKNMLVGAAALAAALIVAFAARVEWGAALSLGCGLFIGSLCGPILARRLPESLIRWSVGLLGLTLAIALAIESITAR